MNKKGFLLGFAVCLSVVAYGKADSNTGMEHIKDEGTHWENQDDRSLSLPFSIQVEGDVLLFGSDKEAEGVSILISHSRCARRYAVVGRRCVRRTVGNRSISRGRFD